LVEDLHRSNAPADAAPAPRQARSDTAAPAEPARRRATTQHDTAPPLPAPAARAIPATSGSPAAPVRGRATVPAYDAPLTAPSTGHIVMLVGPTGAGKTTTIAKLAARAALIDGRRVGMVTLDNYRVGGVDQIRTFADLIGVPLEVAETPAALASLIDPTNDL